MLFLNLPQSTRSTTSIICCYGRTTTSELTAEEGPSIEIDLVIQYPNIHIFFFSLFLIFEKRSHWSVFGAPVFLAPFPIFVARWHRIS